MSSMYGFKELAEQVYLKSGLKLLELLDYNKNNDHLLEVECCNGHSLTLTYNYIRNDFRGCQECKREQKLNKIEEYMESYGDTLLSDEYIGMKTKLHILCPEGHEYFCSFSNYKYNGRRCNQCSKFPRRTYEYVKKLFENKGLMLLSKEYKNTKEPLSYICSNGHEGETTLELFQISNGNGCSKCSGIREITIEVVREEFSEHGMRLITDYYENANQKLYFTCSCGVIDFVTYRKFAYEQGMNRRRKTMCRWCMRPITTTEEERDKTRKYPEYHRFKRLVKERDNYKCVTCGCSENTIVHHLDGYGWCVEKRTDVENGVTLCNDCHYSFHSRYGFKDNTKEQFYEYYDSKKAKTS